MISVKCTNTDCTASTQVPDEYLGKVLRCKKCNTKFTVVNTNGAVPKEKRPAVPTSVAPTVFERPAPFKASPETPAEEGNAGGKRKQLYVFAGLGVVGIFFCLCVICVGGIGAAWLAWGGRSPETYGGIEISSTTVKASVVKFFADADAGFDYEFLTDEEMQVTTNLKKLGSDGDFDPDALDKSVRAVSTFFKDLQQKHNLPDDKIVIVAASGVFKKIEAGKLARNQEKLRSRIYTETRHKMEMVTLEQELERQIKSLIPEKQMDRTLLVDLGNSLCRGGGYDTTLKRFTIFNPKIGVEGFQKKAEADAAKLGYKGSKRPDDRKLLVAAASQGADAHFRFALIEEMKKTTEINGRKRIELIGGTPWVTATYKNPLGRANKHTKLTKQNIDDFYQEVRRDLAYPAFNPPKGLDDKLSRKLNADVDGMEKKIEVETLIAGTEMLKVLSEELTFGNREVNFNNNGQKGLVLGFMTEMWEKGKK